jgi:hypothetical protein
MPLPLKKYTCSNSPTKREQTPLIYNQIRYCVIVHNYGTPIYKASSYVAILTMLEGYIKGRRFAEVNSILANQSRIQVST